LNRGSLVFYRYGALASRLIRTSLGQIVSAMTGPHGDLIPDHRRVVYQPPDGVTDPFLAAGLADFLPEASLLLGERFLVTLVLHRSPRGSVYLAIDVANPAVCVLKRASLNAVLDADGRDACDRLTHEASVLRLLGPDTRFPALLDLVEIDDDLFLAMEEVRGETLEQYIAQRAAQGRLLSTREIVNFSQEIADLLEAIHKRDRNGLASARFTHRPGGDDFGKHLQDLGVATGGVVSDQLIAFEVADGGMEGVSGHIQHLL